VGVILSVVEYNTAGTTPVSRLGTAFGVRWLDDIDDAGSFSFSLPLEDLGTLGVGSVVRFALGDTSDAWVFAGTVETVTIEKTGAAAGGTARVAEISGRGLRARLADAVVYPEIAGETVRTYTTRTPGYILDDLIDEAQARGALTGFTMGFSPTVDSDGDAYPDTLTIDVRSGSTLTEIVGTLEELAVDVWVTPELVIEMVPERGTDRTTGANPLVFRAGLSVSELSAVSAGPISNAVLIASGADGSTFTTETNAGSISTFGRRETFLALSNTTDETVIDLATEGLLDKLSGAAESRTVSLDENGPTPYADFYVGDRVFLADTDGTRAEFRIRAITVTQDQSGRLTFVPELGDVRADLDRRLARLLLRAERNNAAGESGIGYEPIDIDPGGGAIGGGAEVCTVVSYDSSTREGNADCSGVSTDFENGSIWDFYTGDEVFITEADGRNIATGLVQSGGGGVGTQFGFVPPSSVAGLPYDPNVGWDLFQAGEGFVTYDDGRRVIDFVTPSVYTISLPSTSWTNGLALSRLSTGTFAFQLNSDSTSGVSTNTLLVVHNNVATTYNYGGIRTLGVSQGVIYCSCTHVAGSANARIVTIDDTGTVSDFLPTFTDETNASVSYVGPNVPNSASGSWFGAGDWGVVWIPFTGASNAHVYALPAGATAGRRWTVTGRLLFGSSSPNQRWGGHTINDTHAISVDNVGSAGQRESWQRLDLDTGVLETFSNVLPSASLASEIAAGGNGDAVLISGTYDSGSGAVPAYFTTDGGGVTVTTLADTTGTVKVRRDFTGNILGERTDTTAGDLVIGISLS
jgi:hypothetical protein